MTVASIYSSAVTCLNAGTKVGHTNTDIATCVGPAMGARVTATIVDPNLGLAANLASYLLDFRAYQDTLAGRSSH